MNLMDGEKVICKYITPEKGSAKKQVPLSNAADTILQTCILPVLREENAAIMVSGGRGVKSPEGFEMVEELAGLLGAETGASRGAAASGFAPWDRLIGINGKRVRPDLYIACGISGSPQHLFGMRTSARILALTDDPTTPMYQLASYAIVGDLKDVLPELIKVLKQKKWPGETG